MNKKQIVWTIVLVIIVAAIAVWHFAIQNNNSETTNPAVVENSSSTTSSETGTGSGTQVASYPGWKTYSNATSGFAFEYPAAFNVKPVTKSLPFNEIGVTIATTKAVGTTSTTALPQILVTVNKTTASDTVQNDITKITNDPSQCSGSKFQVTTSTVAGQEQALLTCNVKASLNLYPYSIIDFHHGSSGFQVTVSNYPSAATLVQQIVNTFTF